MNDIPTYEDAIKLLETSSNTNNKHINGLINAVIREAKSLHQTLNEWDSLTDDPNKIFTDRFIRDINKKANLYSFSSPLVIAIIGTYQLLVHSGMRTIKAIDDEIDILLQDVINLNNEGIFNYLSRIEQERQLWVNSSLFYAYNGFKIHHINSDEIIDIIYNPNDSTDIWFYVRQYTQIKLDGTTKIVTDIHPTSKYLFSDKMQMKIYQELRRQYHDFTMQWFVPIHSVIVNKRITRLYSVLTWVKCYEQLLNMVATVYSAISAIALVTKTNAEYVTSVASGLEQIKSGNNNHLPVGTIGNNVVLDGDIKTLNAKSALLGANDLDVFLYQVSMVVQLPPHAFGRQEPATGLSDGQNSNELMRLAIEAEQNIWIDLERYHVNHIIKHLVRTNQLTTASIELKQITEGVWYEQVVWNDGVDTTININYPPVRKEDVAKKISSIISAHTLDGKIPNPDISTPREYFIDVMPHLDRHDIKSRLNNIPDTWSDTIPPTDIVEGYATKALNNLLQELQK